MRLLTSASRYQVQGRDREFTFHAPNPIGPEACHERGEKMVWLWLEGRPITDVRDNTSARPAFSLLTRETSCLHIRKLSCVCLPGESRERSGGHLTFSRARAVHSPLHGPIHRLAATFRTLIVVVHNKSPAIRIITSYRELFICCEPVTAEENLAERGGLVPGERHPFHSSE